MKLTINGVNNATHFARQRKDKIVLGALELIADARKTERLERGLCPICFYLPAGLVGHAFTRWTCLGCDVESQHPNMGVPRLCASCAKKHHACARCTANLDLRDVTTVAARKRK